MATHEYALQLAKNFNPDIDAILENGLAAFGIKGSGKSNLVALLVEQLARYFLPQIIFDTEGEYDILLAQMPHGVLASRDTMPSAFDILTQGLQVVINLQSWESPSLVAFEISNLVRDLFTVASSQRPQDRVPCALHLDEAGYWLPQKQVSYLSKEEKQDLLNQFSLLGTRGRKFGLIPFLYTQFISQIDKDVIRSCGIHALMRQSQDVDLDRYSDGYLKHLPARDRAAMREQISQFPAGMAILHGVPGKPTVRFYESTSEHFSHTPKARAAIAKFAKTLADRSSPDQVLYTIEEAAKLIDRSPSSLYVYMKQCGITGHKQRILSPKNGQPKQMTVLSGEQLEQIRSVLA